jgi:polar amino acid transport system substrate-binding protein
LSISVFARSRRRLAATLAICALLWACATATVPDAARQALAPTGELRIAVYPGSPTSLVEAAPPERMRGVSVDLGRALASRLGVPGRIIVFPRVAEALAALQRGEADFMITNATNERAQVVDFAAPLVDLELGVLVPASSRIASVESMDQREATVGVSQGSSSERVLGGRLKQSRLRAFPTLDAVRLALQRGEIDAFATNKGILFELAERAPGSRVLEGRWGTEHLAPAIPKGRAAGLAYLQSFTQEVRVNGDLERAASRAGLRGTIPPTP